MNSRWKLIGGVSILSVGLGVLVLVRSARVSGDTSAPPMLSASSPDDSGAGPGLGAPYSLGSGAIPYGEGSAGLQADVDEVRQTIEATQPPQSVQVFSAAASQMGADAQAQIAAQQVGLEGATNEGVVQ